MSRKDLRDLAASFKKGPEPGESTPDETVDVTAQIERRLAEARKPTVDDPEGKADAEVPDVEIPSPATPAVREPVTARGAPTLRDTEPRRRVPVDMPVVFEPMRQRAGDQGITLTTMVLTALRAEGPALAERAQREGFRPIGGDGFKRWTLLMSEAELIELDDLTTALERALGRRSRARTIAIVLDAHSRR